MIRPYRPVRITVPTYVRDIQGIAPPSFTVGPDGRTSRKVFPLSPLKAQRGGGGKFGGMYSLKRSQRKIRKALAICNALFERTGFAYLVTLTAHPAVDDNDRADQWRHLVDRLRKLPELVAYCWVAEEHRGHRSAPKDPARALARAWRDVDECMPYRSVYGKVHFHLMLVTSKAWDYRADRLVVSWSKRYGDSSNALDIDALRVNGWYLLPYLVKGVTDPFQRGFRLWGSTHLPKALDVQLPVMNLNRIDGWIYDRTPSSSLDADPCLCIDPTIAARAHAHAYIDQKNGRPDFYVWPDGI